MTVLRNDPDFRSHYASFDNDRYRAIVAGMSRRRFDTDTVPGPEPEDILVSEIPALVVPGEDSSHAQ